MAEHNKVAIITDTHFGLRKGSQIFHDYFEDFYKNVFFPKLDELGIDTVIHMGDVFDVRKGIDYWSLAWSKRVFFDELVKRNIETHIIVGNHDIFYKTSLKIHSPGLNLTEYPNITTYDTPQVATIKSQEVFMIPWICEDNVEQFTKILGTTNSKLAMGHLEISGFYANQNYQCTTGIDAHIFSSFERVFSGHFHKKNTTGNITYLGNPYQLYWSDEGDVRGFHIFDLGTMDLDFVPNPYRMYSKIYYNDTKKQKINLEDYEKTYIKLIVEKSSSQKKLTELIDNLYSKGIHDLKVIETFDIKIDDDVEIESEDTLTSIGKYIYAMEDSFDKEQILNIMKSLYVESQEV
ncbi:endonuclease [Synechococcus phage S-CRM01]|uniref:SbcD-like subunit of palindrome specific endonuclease n=1 Tax=Synechococcus phage S-CRM01 TaxID=1026955 RepID=UPI000209E35E|nr:SbcD-like subunit of palindrome specific endonuclease [Synechococcus phage S-CRM01]AEC52999.1 endonuclease [Synechococcus phage S-CRM01]